MKRIFTLAAFSLLIGLTAFTPNGIPHNKAQIVLHTSTGDLVYNSGTVPTYLDPLGHFRIDLKPSGFSADDKSLNNVLYNLVKSSSYGLITFDGKLEQGVEKLKDGQSIKTAAVGKLKMAGYEMGQRIPLTALRKGATYYFTVNALIDWTKTPTTNLAGTELHISAPIQLTITPVVK